MRLNHQKIGRNNPCPCGSKKKYKRCCLNKAGEEKQDHPGQYFNIKGKIAEEIVHNLAKNTFLSDWCYLNPKLPDGKELCDLLIVYDDTAIIWQIKDLKLDENNRYKKEEVEKNLRQLSGARRSMFDLKTNITLTNPRRGDEVFSPQNIKNIYLVSVLFGQGEDYLSPIENIRGHMAHIFTRDFTQIILTELDTIYDFTEYLKAKEALIKTKKEFLIGGGEEELLATYLLENRSFSQFDGYDFITIGEGYWEMFQEKPEYKAKKAEDKISYIWDGIINRAYEGGKVTLPH
jgi:SEC-C motif